MKEMSAQILNDYLQQCECKPVLLDVRQPWEVERCCMEGVLHIPMGSIPRLMKDLDPEQEIVVICHHGVRSRQVGRYLEQNGFTHIINLSGGIEQWARDVDLTMARY